MATAAPVAESTTSGSIAAASTMSGRLSASPAPIVPAPVSSCGSGSSSTNPSVEIGRVATAGSVVAAGTSDLATPRPRAGPGHGGVGPGEPADAGARKADDHGKGEE